MEIGRRRVTLGIVAAAVVLLAGAATLKWSESRGFEDLHQVLGRFPAEDAVALHIDFAGIRKAGLLTDSSVPLEAEYKQFLDGTGFDYRKDLDEVTASFSKSGNFFIARGRFNWRKLRDYAAKQGGSCYEDLCRMQGSQPDRRISFLPLEPNMMALAVSTDDLAANRLAKAGAPVKTELPSAPVWVLVPGSMLRESAVMPPGMALMLSALKSADRLVVTVSASGNALAAKMEATCQSQDDAKVLASQLRIVTAKLKTALSEDPRAQGDELVKVLAGGTFDDSGVRVNGQWPFSKELIASLTSGI
ncbi:MAG TPA: hypothetical protein VGM43_24700 [Bryobacteraceae bacterium]|jgi:hypothetical protein